MAFMCPIRIGRSNKKKRESRQAGTGGGGGIGGEKFATPTIGRITGSASIETLVRVGLEKEHGLGANSKVVVLHDFTPCVDDEMGVSRGQVVHTLYQENDWMYVISEDGSREGFIPQSYCAPVGSSLADMALSITKKKPRERRTEDHLHHHHHQSSLESSIAHSDIESVDTPSCCTEVHPFFKDSAGRYLVLYTFVARDENDLSVERGELVTVLNREDPDWFWVLRSDGQEGFVPSAFVYPADVIEAHAQGPDALDGPGPTMRQEATSQVPPSKQDLGLGVSDLKQIAFGSLGGGSDGGSGGGGQKEYRYDTKSGTVSSNTYHNGSVVNAFNAARHSSVAEDGNNNNNTCSGSVSSININNSSNSNNNNIGNTNGNHVSHLNVSSTAIPAAAAAAATTTTTTVVGGRPWTNEVESSNSGTLKAADSGTRKTSQDCSSTSSRRLGQDDVDDLDETRGGIASAGGGSSSSGGAKVSASVPPGQSEQYRAKGTELVMLYDYVSQADDDLGVKRGEWVYADLNCQTVDGWLWAFCPRLAKYGFIPKAYARPPAMTSL